MRELPPGVQVVQGNPLHPIAQERRTERLAPRGVDVVAVPSEKANKHGARRTVVFTMPYIPPREAFPRAFEGRHWSHRSGVKAMMVNDMMVMARGFKGKPFEKAHISITWRSPRGNYDADNALSASKGWIDGLVRAGVLRNDTVLRVSYELHWKRTKQESTEITVTEVEDG